MIPSDSQTWLAGNSSIDSWFSQLIPYKWLQMEGYIMLYRSITIHDLPCFQGPYPMFSGTIRDYPPEVTRDFRGFPSHVWSLTAGRTCGTRTAPSVGAGRSRAHRPGRRWAAWRCWESPPVLLVVKHGWWFHTVWLSFACKMLPGISCWFEHVWNMFHMYIFGWCCLSNPIWDDDDDDDDVGDDGDGDDGDDGDGGDGSDMKMWNHNS